MDISRDKLIEMQRKMLLARAVDDKLYELNTTGAFTGWLHLAAGQEAMPAALGVILRQDDYVKISSRGQNMQVSKGIPLVNILAFYMGRGVPGPSPYFAPEYGILGASVTLGEEAAIYVGAALASKLQKEDRVTAVLFGDGTFNKGCVHEAINLAACWDLPVVWVCENNQYAISMRWDKSCRANSLADRATAYGMPGVEVDGNDVIACYEAALAAVERARSGGGPSLIEVKTYRYHGHFEGDPEMYRTKEEVAEARKKDPIILFRDRLVHTGIITAEEADRMAAEAKAAVEAAVEEVQQTPRGNLDALRLLYPPRRAAVGA